MRSRLRYTVRSPDGFTLVEMVAVGAILAILAMVSIPAVTSSLNKAKVNNAKNSLFLMRTALTRYYASQASDSNDGNYPKAPSGIVIEFDATNPATSFVYATNYYWTQPPSGVRNYDFLRYVSDGNGLDYRLCILAQDNSAVSSRTVLRIKSDGAVDNLDGYDPTNVAAACPAP